MASQPPAYIIEPALLEKQKTLILDLWSHGLANMSVRDKKFDWDYLCNPAGEGNLFLLKDAKTADYVGVESVGMRRWQLHNEVKTVGIFVDLVVDKQHRSLGPAMMLLKGAFAAVKDRLNLVYLFPNKKAEPVFKRAGFSRLGDIVRYSRLLKSYDFVEGRLGAFAARLLSPVLDRILALLDWFGRVKYARKYCFSACQQVDQKFDELWMSAQLKSVCMAVRDGAFVKWRHGKDPVIDGKTLYILRSNVDQVLSGYLVCYQDNEILKVQDFLAVDGEALYVMLIRLFALARAQGAKSISLEFLGTEQVLNILNKAGFHPRGGRPVYMSSDIAGLDQPEAWYMTAADEDV